MSKFEVVTTAERPELQDQFDEAFRPVWPEFIFHDSVSNQYVSKVQERFPLFDVTVVDGGKVVAGGWGVVMSWNQAIADLPDGYDGALVRSMSANDLTSGNTLSVMAAAVRPDRQGQGLSTLVLTELRERAIATGLISVIAPVRPTLKASYPLTPMETFASWRRSDGTHVDPWIRLHERLGAQVLGVALQSMVISGSVEDWERWTGMLFPDSGQYVVPDALDLVAIDRDANVGTYVEPNLWMRHC
jgi:GNAT superfamily N-acetyltransferase